MIVSAISGGVLGVILVVFFGSSSGVGLSLFQSKEQKTNQQIDNLLEEENATIHVVERVTPSVVSVVVKKKRSEAYGDFVGGPPLLPKQDPNEWIEVSSGTGFFVTSDGLVLTNRHVVNEKNAQFIIVKNDGEERPAQLVDTDSFLDIAILRTEGSGFPAATLGDSDTVRIGQTVIAVGNALSEFRNTVTKGVVSGVHRRVTAGTSLSSSEVIDQAIQTDAAINPGNSGGPLINLRGEVIGMNTAISIGGDSVAFSIPINQAKKVISDVVSLGRIVRPWVGIRYIMVDVKKEFPDVQGAFDSGAVIVKGRSIEETGVFKGGPADKAGLKEGDVVLTINDEVLTKEKELSERIFSMKPGDIIQLTILREKKILRVSVTLGEYEHEKK